MSEIINAVVANTIQAVSVYLYGSMIFLGHRKKLSLFQKYFFFIIFTLTFIIIFLFVKGTLKSIFMCVSFALFFISFFKVNLLQSFFASTIFIILLVIPDLIVLGVSDKIFGLSNNYIYSSFAGSILSNFFVNILMLILIYILRKPLRKLINCNLFSEKKIVIVSLMTFVSLLIFFYKLIEKYRISTDVLNYLFVIATLFFVLFYLFKEKINSQKIIKKYDDLLNIMKNYEKDIEEQRTFIHETKNEIISIKSKINDDVSKDKLIGFVDDILGDKKCSIKMNKYATIEYLPLNGLRGFLYYKLVEASNLGINVSLKVSPKIEKSFLGEINTKNFKDLVRIFGVYIDNAIYASKESTDKKLGIEIYLINNVIEIIITNTFDEIIDEEKLGKVKYSTKGENHGHGLLLVKHILMHNDIFNVNTKIIKNLYIQKLKIKNLTV